MVAEKRGQEGEEDAEGEEGEEDQEGQEGEVRLRVEGSGNW